MITKKPVVYIVDDDASVLKSLDRLVGAAGYAVETFSSAEKFMHCSALRAPACAVLDVRLPDGNGFSLLKQIRRHNSAVPVIFISGHGDIPMSVSAIKEGAVDFLPKPFSGTHLLNVIGEALIKSNELCLKNEEVGGIMNDYNTLSVREREVMGLVMAGYLNKQIARQLSISEKTVKIHRGRVMHKMNVTSVANLIKLASKAGITPS